jgi:energy-coupling factor transporter ATP-binding protein EcfA2
VNVLKTGIKYLDYLKLAPGQVVLVVGPTGSGKSTLCRSISYELEDRGMASCMFCESKMQYADCRAERTAMQCRRAGDPTPEEFRPASVNPESYEKIAEMPGVDAVFIDDGSLARLDRIAHHPNVSEYEQRIWALRELAAKMEFVLFITVPTVITVPTDLEDKDGRSHVDLRLIPPPLMRAASVCLQPYVHPAECGCHQADITLLKSNPKLDGHNTVMRCFGKRNLFMATWDDTRFYRGTKEYELVSYPKLAPCPFCGCGCTIVRMAGGAYRWLGEHEPCLLDEMVGANYPSAENVAEDWNHRKIDRKRKQPKRKEG